jgi:hypothetical protein
MINLDFHVFSSYMASLCIIDLPYSFETHTYSYNASSNDNKSIILHIQSSHSQDAFIDIGKSSHPSKFF